MLVFAIAVTTVAFAGDLPVRWVPDPATSGATQVYVPDGYDCVEIGVPSNMSCWPSGTRPTSHAQFFIDRGNRVFVDTTAARKGGGSKADTKK